MTKKYALETNDEDFIIEIPDDAFVNMQPGDTGLTWSVEVLRKIESDDLYAPRNTLAFYRGVKAVRCLDEVKRDEPQVA